MKLNIGCGLKKMEGYLNIDNREEHEPDLWLNVEKGLPFCSNGIDEIYASHFIEHVSDLVGVMKEFHRVLKPNGILTLIYPAYPDARVFSSPYHKQFLAPDSFRWFTKGQDPHEHPDFYFSIEEEKNLGQGDTIEQRVIMRPVK